MPTDTNEGAAEDVTPADRPLLVAGRLSHPDYENNRIKLPNLYDLIVTSNDAKGNTRKRSK